MSNLLSLKLKLSMKGSHIILENTRDAIDLSDIFKQLLMKNNFIHIIFHDNDGNLLY